MKSAANRLEMSAQPPATWVDVARPAPAAAKKKKPPTTRVKETPNVWLPRIWRPESMAKGWKCHAD